jgi:hypothetical protein
MPGHTRYDDSALRKQQGKLILARRLSGESVGSLAENFRLSEDTIARRLREAVREANIEGAKDRVIDELLGSAIEAFKVLLAQGDYNAARDVLQGLGVLPKNGPPQTDASVKVEMTLDQWREMRKRSDEERTAEAAAITVAEGDSTIDGEATLLAADEDDDSGSERAPDIAKSGEGV